MLDGPLFATGLPGKFALHVRIEALKNGEAVWGIVVKPAGAVEPIPIVAGVHGTELDVIVTDDVSVKMAWLERFSGLYAISNGIDHAVAKFSWLIQYNNFWMFVVVEKSSGIGPRMA